MSEVVKHPTWYANIRDFFTDEDKTHMRAFGLELCTYEGVKGAASTIYSQVSAGNMPPPPEGPWPQWKVTTFLNWMIDDYPKGVPATGGGGGSSQPGGGGSDSPPSSGATRIRKEIRELSTDEVDKLKKAWNGIAALSTDDLNSFFVQAGYHWYPGPGLYCLHHVNKYNPWHRAYLHSFEDALRSIEGCEDVTLPYWDFQNLKEFPSLLTEAPFNEYTLPTAIGPEGTGSNAGPNSYPQGYTTQRYSIPNIIAGFEEIQSEIEYAMSQTTWENFNGLGHVGFRGIMGAHDSGHVDTGPTMASQSVAAMDPIFFFFHANWDRLWWKWQQEMGATDLNGFISTISDDNNKNEYTIPVLMSLDPFPQKTTDTIDLVKSLDTDYQHPKGSTPSVKVASAVGSVNATDKFNFNTTEASVRVKGIDRSKIKGSFKVHLTKDGKTIAKRGFFQPSDPVACPNCIDHPVISLDFVLPLKSIEGGKLGVVVEPVDKEYAGDRLSLKHIGNPSVNARLLMKTE